jgi:hypothetical protein
VYARCCKDGTFHNQPWVAMEGTVLILRAEGCKVTKPVVWDGIPRTVHSK